MELDHRFTFQQAGIASQEDLANYQMHTAEEDRAERLYVGEIKGFDEFFML